MELHGGGAGGGGRGGGGDGKPVPIRYIGMSVRPTPPRELHLQGICLVQLTKRNSTLKWISYRNVAFHIQLAKILKIGIGSYIRHSNATEIHLNLTLSNTHQKGCYSQYQG